MHQLGFPLRVWEYSVALPQLTQHTMKHILSCAYIVALGCHPAMVTHPAEPLASGSEKAKSLQQERCLQPTFAHAALGAVTLSNGNAKICYAMAGSASPEEQTCATIDPQGRVLMVGATHVTPAPNVDDASGDDAFETTTNVVRICKRGTSRCSTLSVPQPQIPDREQAPLEAALRKDGEQAFVFTFSSGNSERMEMWGDTFDVKSGKRLFHQKLTGGNDQDAWTFRDISNTRKATYAGRNLLLEDASCCGPGSTSYAFDPERGTLKALHHYRGSATYAAANRWLILDEARAFLFDMDTLQQVGPTTQLAVKIPEEADEQVAKALRFDAHRLLVAYARRPGFVWIDTDRGEASTPASLLCGLAN